MYVVCGRACVCVAVYIPTYINLCIHTHTHTQKNIHTHTHTHVHTNTHEHTHTHDYLHMHTKTPPSPLPPKALFIRWHFTRRFTLLENSRLTQMRARANTHTHIHTSTYVHVCISTCKLRSRTRAPNLLDLLALRGALHELGEFALSDPLRPQGRVCRVSENMMAFHWYCMYFLTPYTPREIVLSHPLRPQECG